MSFKFLYIIAMGNLQSGGRMLEDDESREMMWEEEKGIEIRLVEGRGKMMRVEKLCGKRKREFMRN